MNKKIYWSLGITVLLAIWLGTFLYLKKMRKTGNDDPLITNNGLDVSSGKDSIGSENKIVTFKSEEDFKSYLEKAEEMQINEVGLSRFSGLGEIREFKKDSLERSSLSLPSSMNKESQSIMSDSFTPQEDQAYRTGTTNVQVIGIDEPDLLKTDGKRLFYSGNFGDDWVYMEERPTVIMSEPESLKEQNVRTPWQSKTLGIKALPLEQIEKEGEIKEQGELLLKGNTLVVFSQNRKIIGYDVSSSNYKEKWKMKVGDDQEIVTSRLQGENLYLITRNYFNQDRLCPIQPLIIEDNPKTEALEDKATKIQCDSIYHPTSPIPVDSNYNVVVFNIETGEIKKSASFLGSNDNTVVYMSEENLYVTYNYPGDFLKFSVNFIRENKDLFKNSEKVLARLDKLQGYEISRQAKFNEMQMILDDWYRALNKDERLRIENEAQNRLGNYSKKHFRELERTGIIKLDIEDLKVVASKSVPGELLNQFSLDEYKGTLRVAVTVGGRSSFSWMVMGGGQVESENDVYVLNEDLKIIGEIKGLGITERIYSARFIEERGYIVTFRETDPLYVIDLRNPEKPKVSGELKIPGYSSYLHPVGENFVLGIGKEGSQVKISLFDVSDPNNPEEKSKYLMQESWSDILNTHHAFLMDKKHRIFFIPGSRGGYIFSYADKNELKLIKAVEETGVNRAIYLNDYLYILGKDKLTVIDENSWEKVKELDLR